MTAQSSAQVKIVVFYVGTSLLAPLRRAERRIQDDGLKLKVAVHNSGAAWSEPEWRAAEQDLIRADVVFIMHVTDSENSCLLYTSPSPRD